MGHRRGPPRDAAGEQAALPFFEPGDRDPDRRAKIENAVRAIARGYYVHMGDYSPSHELVVTKSSVLVAFRAFGAVIDASRYMGKVAEVVAAFERWAEALDEHHRGLYRKALGDYDSPDWRPTELLPEDFYA